MAATAAQEYALAMQPHQMWGERLPVCICEFQAQGARCLRLVLAVLARVLVKAERALVWNCPYLPGWSTESGRA